MLCFKHSIDGEDAKIDFLDNISLIFKCYRSIFQKDSVRRKTSQRLPKSTSFSPAQSFLSDKCAFGDELLGLHTSFSLLSCLPVSILLCLLPRSPGHVCSVAGCPAAARTLAGGSRATNRNGNRHGKPKREPKNPG